MISTEMFEKLGYRCIGCGAFIDDMTGIQIDCGIYSGFVRKFSDYEHEDFTPEEIIACAQFLKERKEDEEEQESYLPL